MTAVQKKDNEIVPLISTAQVLTGAFADLGAPVNTMDCQSIALWLKLTVNNSLNVRVRMVGMQTETATDLYNPQIQTPSASDVKVENEYFEINVDADQKIVLSFPTVDLLPYVKFQVMAATVGVTPGQITAAGVSFRSPRED